MSIINRNSNDLPLRAEAQRSFL